jgi:hypothetical protein
MRSTQYFLEAAGEGIAIDPAGNLFAAEATVRGVTKYVKD